MSDRILSLSDVSSGYRGKTVVHHISLQVQRGEILTLAGPNGCGKSTLLKTASRLLPCREGNILLEGKSLSDYSPKELARKVSVLPQSRSVPAITVGNLVLHGRFPYLGLSRKLRTIDREIAERAMESAGVSKMRMCDLRELSGGERQKAYLAMVIAQDTELVFLDEPTTYLDIGRQFEILELVRQLNQRGKTVVMVLHDLAHALTYSHRIAVMQEGKLLCVEKPEILFRHRLLDQVFGVQGCREEKKGVYYFMPAPKS